MPAPRKTLIDPRIFEVKGTQLVLDPMDVEGLPRTRIMAPVLELDPDVVQPTYRIFEVSKIFFGREKRYIYNIILSEGWEKLAQHPDAITPYDRNVRWTLDEVERLIHILNDLGRISYTRTVIALHIVAWTAKAHGLYV